MRRFLVSSTLLAVTAASGQTAWVNPVSGNWNDATKWATGNAPDSPGEIAQIAVAGTYAIDYNISAVIGGLSLTNASATVNNLPNTTMAIGGTTWTNSGLVVLNSTGGALGTFLRSDVPALTLAGSGLVRLNAEPSNLDTAQMNTNNGAFVVTNSASHNVKGCGRIRIAFDNDGLVEADVATRTLELAQFPKSNSGTMRPTNGGVLQFNGVGVNNTDGQIVASGSNSIVNVISTGISGGTISATGGGLGQTSNSSYSDVMFEGPHDVLPNTTFIIVGSGITNDGVITVNPTAANLGTFVRTDVAEATLGGSGTLRLNALAANLDTAALNTNNGAFVLTNGEDHTIRGMGRIRIAMINDGVIRADGAADFVDLTQFGKTNNARIEAINGGTVQVSGIGLTNNPSGVIRADGTGSIASYVSSGIGGGNVSASNGGLGSISNSTFSDLTVNGPHQVNGNTVLAIAGSGITNNGTITVNPAADNFGTFLRTDVAAATIDGTGVIHLNATPANLDTAQVNTNNGAFVLTMGPNQTVNGTGAIRIAMVNNGLIDANENGKTLALRQFNKTNNATMRATNGGTLSIESIGVTNNSQIRADGAGSVVSYVSSGINGGQVIAAGGGVGSISNSTFSNLTVSGPHVVNANTVLAIAGAGITNNGTITVNPTAGNLGTFLRTDVAAATIGGAGTIHLNAHPANLDTAQVNTNDGNFVLTIGANQTVNGTGAIRINTVNNGLMDANVSGLALALRQFNKTNNAVMRATNGATLSIESIGVTNSGEIRADGAGSIVSYVSSGVGGGNLSAVNGGVGSISNSTFSDLTLSGPHVVNANTTLAIAGTSITNNGTLTVNPTAANQGTFLRTAVTSGRINGTGSVHLNANPANLDTAQLNTFDGNFILAFGPDQTLSGTGAIRINTVIEGTLSPGSTAAPIGRIEQRQFALTMAPSATVEVDLAGLAAGQFDTIGAVGAVTLDGTLEVHLASGFNPVLGDEFVILTAASRIGTFEQIVTPNPGPNNAWRVRYEPTRAVLTITCPPDIDGDHTVSLQDLAVLLANFGTQSGAGGVDGDLDGDGDVELQDLAALLATFGTNCP